MLILLYCCTIWTLTKRLKKKTWWKLHKNAPYCFEQILETAPHKTTAVRPLTFNLTNHSSRRTRHAAGVLWTHTHGHVSIGRPPRTYKHQLSADTGCCLEDRPGTMDDKNGQNEKESRDFALSTGLGYDNDIQIRTNSWATFSHGLQDMDTLVLAEQLKFTFFSSVRALDGIERTYQKRWPIGIDGESSQRSLCSRHALIVVSEGPQSYKFS